MAVEVQPTRVARGPRYGGNGGDGISHRIIFERVRSIGQSAARDVGAPACVD